MDELSIEIQQSMVLVWRTLLLPAVGIQPLLWDQKSDTLPTKLGCICALPFLRVFDALFKDHLFILKPLFHCYGLLKILSFL